MEERILGLIGDDKVEKLKNAKVLVVGVGGVGGYSAEILARSMIGELILIDGDIVEDSNRNRQIVALTNTIGKTKVDVLKERISLINPNCKVQAIFARVDQTSIDDIFKLDFNYIIDAIDSLKDKALLIEKAKKTNKYIISSMGIGNRYKVANVVKTDLFKTQYDPLAKKLRNLLRGKIEKSDVVICDSPSDLTSKVTFSIAYNPAIMGASVAGYLIEEIIK